jgi:hypothetical protein
MPARNRPTCASAAASARVKHERRFWSPRRRTRVDDLIKGDALRHDQAACARKDAREPYAVLNVPAAAACAHASIAHVIKGPPFDSNHALEGAEVEEPKAAEDKVAPPVHRRTFEVGALTHVCAAVAVRAVRKTSLLFHGARTVSARECRRRKSLRPSPPSRAALRAAAIPYQLPAEGEVCGCEAHRARKFSPLSRLVNVSPLALCEENQRGVSASENTISQKRHARAVKFRSGSQPWECT